MLDLIRHKEAAVESLSGPSPAILSGILNRLEDPVLLVDQERKILYRNRAAELALKSSSGVVSRLGRLVVSDFIDDDNFEQLLQGCQPSAVKGMACRGLKVARRTSSRDWFVLISSLAHAPPQRLLLVQLVSRLQRRSVPKTALRDLFGLTSKEAEVLAHLMQHDSLRDIATQMKLAHETIRAYVKRILHRCEVGSRGELMALLQRLACLSEEVA